MRELHLAWIHARLGDTLQRVVATGSATDARAIDAEFAAHHLAGLAVLEEAIAFAVRALVRSFPAATSSTRATPSSPHSTRTGTSSSRIYPTTTLTSPGAVTCRSDLRTLAARRCAGSLSLVQGRGCEFSA